MSQKPIAYDWALVLLALIWATPIVVHFFADFPLELTLGVIAWGLSVLVVVTWVVRPVRRQVYHPNAAERGGPNQVAAAVFGFAFVGFAVLCVFPPGWFE